MNQARALMNIETILRFVSILILILLTIFEAYGIKPTAAKTIIYVDDDFIIEDPTHKRTIQSAINIAKPGDIIRVAAGTYYENVYISVNNLEITGEGSNSTIIDGGGIGDTIHITADNVKITGFTIRNSGSKYPNSGIFLSATAERCYIFNNRVINNKGHGIFLMWSSNNIVSNNTIRFNSEPGIRIDVSKNTITNNVIENNSEGIFLYVAYNCIIENNTISNNLKSGITPQGGSRNITIRNNIITNNGWNGIFFYASNTSLVEQNVLSNNKWGIQMVDGSNCNKIIKNEILNNQEGVVLINSFKNIVRNNRIEKNKYGIKLLRSSGNEISYNNFINNEQQVEISESTNNNWDDGSKGNYWNDYQGVDSNNDGIGDTPYTIDSNNRDICPLINKVEIFGQHEKTNTILLDIYHSGHDFSSFTSLQHELISYGFNIEKLSGPLSTTPLSSCSIIWIDGCFYGKKFSDSDLAMIIDFVNNGGALFLTINGWIWIPYGTSEANRTIHNYPGNVLARCFGVVSNNDYYIDDVNKHPMIRDQECFIDHPITQGVHQLDTAHCVISTLNVSNGVVIIRGSKYSESTWGLGPYKKGSYPPLLVAIQYGKGRVVITGLSNGAFLDGDTDNDGIADIDEFDNKLFALNIFKWMVNITQVDTPNIVAESDENNNQISRTFTVEPKIVTEITNVRMPTTVKTAITHMVTSMVTGISEGKTNSINVTLTIIPWWIKHQLLIITGVIGLILFVIIPATFMMARRKHVPPSIELEIKKEIKKYEGYLEKLEQVRKEGKVSEKAYEILKEEYKKKIEELIDKLKK